MKKNSEGLRGKEGQSPGRKRRRERIRTEPKETWMLSVKEAGHKRKEKKERKHQKKIKGKKKEEVRTMCGREGMCFKFMQERHSKKKKGTIGPRGRQGKGSGCCK